MGLQSAGRVQSIPLSQWSKDELLSRCETLQRNLQTVTMDRDDLQRDVEQLCMQAGSATFDASSVLRERLYSTESQLARAKADCHDVTIERDGFREDQVHLKQSKRLSDKSWKEEREKNSRLEKDLSFYQEQSATAMQDRDKAQSEAEQLRELKEKLEESAASLSEDLASEKARSGELDRRNRERTAIVKELTAKAAIAEQVPGLKRDLQNRKAAYDAAVLQRKTMQRKLEESKTLVAQLKAKDEDLVTTISGLETSLENSKNELASYVADQKLKMDALQTICDEKTDELQRTQEKVSELTTKSAEHIKTIEKLESDLVNAIKEEESKFDVKRSELESLVESLQAETKVLTAAAEARDKEISELQAELATTKESCRTLKEEADADKALVIDMQVSLQQLAQEKIELLVETADLKELVRDGSTMDNPENEDAWTAWPWKPQFGKQRGPGKGPAVSATPALNKSAHTVSNKPEPSASAKISQKSVSMPHHAQTGDSHADTALSPTETNLQ